MKSVTCRRARVHPRIIPASIITTTVHTGMLGMLAHDGRLAMRRGLRAACTQKHARRKAEDRYAKEKRGEGAGDMIEVDALGRDLEKNKYSSSENLILL